MKPYLMYLMILISFGAHAEQNSRCPASFIGTWMSHVEGLSPYRLISIGNTTMFAYTSPTHAPQAFSYRIEKNDQGHLIVKGKTFGGHPLDGLEIQCLGPNSFGLVRRVNSEVVNHISNFTRIDLLN